MPEGIRKLARAPRPMALLLVGETGIGKEIAARVLFEGIAMRLLRALAGGKDATALPVVPGPRFIAVNCAALTETLSASELSGGIGSSGDTDPICIGREDLDDALIATRRP